MTESEYRLPPLAPSESAPLAERVAGRIRVAILSGALKPGTPLVERELAEHLNVSKTPVREALKILSKGGLVSSNLHRGAAVRAVDHAMVRGVCEVRILLEPAAVALATPLHTEGTLSEIEELVASRQAANMGTDIAEQSLLGRKFHQLLYAPCDNGHLVEILDVLQDQLALMTVVGWEAKDQYAEESHEHDEILRAVREGDAAAAAMHTRHHILGFVKRNLLDVMDVHGYRLANDARFHILQRVLTEDRDSFW